MTDDLTIDLDAIRERLDSVAQIAQLTGERDRARDMAVALEAELATAKLMRFGRIDE